nr:Na+/H+ antiporter NhaC family protein [uncultured Halomonas sp.]
MSAFNKAHMAIAAWVAFCALSLLLLFPAHVHGDDAAVELDLPEVVLRDIPFEAKVSGIGDRLADGADVVLQGGDQRYSSTVMNGNVTFEEVIVTTDPAELRVLGPGDELIAETQANTLAGWASLVPAVLAILLALATRQVIPALFFGLWMGGALVYGSLAGLWYGFLDTMARYMVDVLTDWSHVAILLFSFMIGGLVGIISKNGGTRGIINWVIGLASTPRRGQLSTGLMGLAVFFDDYANTLIVGNTMRPITDRLRVSREKLAYIVDSTAAPVATVFFITTWIGFLVGLIGDATGELEGYSEGAYSIFLNSIGYSFYPLLAVTFVFMVAGSGRDFGPMLQAERRARTKGQLSRPGALIGDSTEEGDENGPKADKPQRAVNAVVPILVLVIGSMVGIYLTGLESAGPDASLREIIGNGDSFLGLMWASLLAVTVAAVMSVAQGILNLGEVIDSWHAGVRSMLMAMVILLLAWSLSDVNGVLHTGDYLVSTLGDTLPAPALPTLVFVLSAATAFATGSSWGVMGIMMPLVLPLTWTIMQINDLTADGEHLYLLYASVSAVLAGAVWGDHCSPISDTTILSSLASKCDHIDHVRTQIPYAVVVGVVAILGLVAAGFAVPWWLVLAIGAAVLFATLRFFGRRVDDVSASETLEPAVEREGDR